MLDPRDDMLDDLMSDEEGSESYSSNDYDDYNEPSFGSDDPDDYSAGFLSTIWEENTQGEESCSLSAAGSFVGSQKSSLAPTQNSKSLLNASFFHDSANRDLYEDSQTGKIFWKSYSDSFATGEMPLYNSEDEYSLETLDSSKITDRKAMKRWSSEMSYSSMNGSMSISSGSTGTLISKVSADVDLISDSSVDEDQTPRTSHRKQPLVRSFSDSSLNSASSSSNPLNEKSKKPSLEEALMALKKADFSLQKKPLLGMSRDALLAQLMRAYVSDDGGKADVGNSDSSSNRTKSTATNLSLESYLLASEISASNHTAQTSSSRRNQPPGKPVRRYSFDSISSTGENSEFSGISGNSLADRLQRRPDANAFNADEQDGKNDTPPIVTRKKQEGRKTPPGIPVRQRSFISLAEDDASETETTTKMEEDSLDGNFNASSSSAKSFGRSSYMSASSADMTIEEGDENASSSDDETLDSDAEDVMPPPQPRQYLAPIKVGVDTDTVDSDTLDGDSSSNANNNKSMTLRQYLAPLKGSEHEEDDHHVLLNQEQQADLAVYLWQDGRQYLAPLKGEDEPSSIPSKNEEGDLERFLKQETRQYVVPLKDSDEPSSAQLSSTDDPMEITEDGTTKKEICDDGDSMMPTATTMVPVNTPPQITAIPMPSEDERVDASFVIEKHLLKEKAPQSPGTLAKRRGSGGKRKLKYDMARLAISPKIDRLISPVGKVAPVTQKLSIPPTVKDTDVLPITSSSAIEPESTPSKEFEDPFSDPETSPFRKTRSLVDPPRGSKDDRRIRIRGFRNMMGDSALPEEDIEKDVETETTTGSSEFEMLEAIAHSNHSRGRSTRISMAGTLDESDHSRNIVLSPKSPSVELDASDRSCNSAGSIGKKGKLGLKKGFQRGRRRLKNLFRPVSGEEDAPDQPLLSIQ